MRQRRFARTAGATDDQLDYPVRPCEQLTSDHIIITTYRKSPKVSNTGHTSIHTIRDAYSGMMAALIGGLIVSIVLFIMKKTMVREELRLNNRKVKVAKFIELPVPYFEWVEIDPRT